MFFPHSNEKVLTVKEQDQSIKKLAIENKTFKVADYLKYPTVIFCNPNAVQYQQQVHSSNAYWLKYFLSNKINVMVWNYRSYGRSSGTPDPYITYHDSEAVLKFIINNLGLKGKIGCFGRSLGGAIASHLANYYPKIVEFLFVDRSFGTLDSMVQSFLFGNRN
jgi:alpha/beta superfamily hydrolase